MPGRSGCACDDLNLVGRGQELFRQCPRRMLLPHRCSWTRTWKNSSGCATRCSCVPCASARSSYTTCALCGHFSARKDGFRFLDGSAYISVHMRLSDSMGRRARVYGDLQGTWRYCCDADPFPGLHPVPGSCHSLHTYGANGDGCAQYVLRRAMRAASRVAVRARGRRRNALNTHVARSTHCRLLRRTTVCSETVRAVSAASISTQSRCLWSLGTLVEAVAACEGIRRRLSRVSRWKVRALFQEMITSSYSYIEPCTLETARCALPR